MMGWLEFVAAVVVFFLSHALPVRPPLRPWLTERLGKVGFTLGYSGLSLLLLAWLLSATLRAPVISLWAGWPLLDWAPLLLMPPACLLAVAGLTVANPFSFGGRPGQDFNPKQPGILAVTRHPLLIAIALWAMAHLIASGYLAQVVLFGTLTSGAIAGMLALDRRRQREWGHTAWQNAAKLTAIFSLKGLSRLRFSAWELGASALLFLLLLLLHGPVFETYPLVLVGL